MDRMMRPVFDDATIEATRLFFHAVVSGRGALPAIRVGAQPYGILSGTSVLADAMIAAVASIGAPRPRRRSGFLGKLYELLKKADQDWAALVARVVRRQGRRPASFSSTSWVCTLRGRVLQRTSQMGDQLFNQFR